MRDVPLPHADELNAAFESNLFNRVEAVNGRAVALSTGKLTARRGVHGDPLLRVAQSRPRADGGRERPALATRGTRFADAPGILNTSDGARRQGACDD